jgi:hypothetical protein
METSWKQLGCLHAVEILMIAGRLRVEGDLPSMVNALSQMQHLVSLTIWSHLSPSFQNSSANFEVNLPCLAKIDLTSNNRTTNFFLLAWNFPNLVECHLQPTEPSIDHLLCLSRFIGRVRNSLAQQNMSPSSVAITSCRLQAWLGDKDEPLAFFEVWMDSRK